MPVKPIPDGYPTVTPYLTVENATRFIAFMTEVFDASTTERLLRADGTIGHAELRVGDSLIMLAEANGAHGPLPVTLHIYVTDVDAAFERALAAGASVVTKPANQFYGDRTGGVREPTGNTLWIATHVEDVSPAELERRAAAALSPKT